MKFKVKIQVGVVIPGIGPTKKNKEFEIEAESLADAFNQVDAKYREANLQHPNEYASWSVSIALAAPAAQVA